MPSRFVHVVACVRTSFLFKAIDFLTYQKIFFYFSEIKHVGMMTPPSLQQRQITSWNTLQIYRKISVSIEVLIGKLVFLRKVLFPRLAVYINQHFSNTCQCFVTLFQVPTVACQFFWSVEAANGGNQNDNSVPLGFFLSWEAVILNIFIIHNHCLCGWWLEILDRLISHYAISPGFPVFSHLSPFTVLKFSIGSCGFNLFTCKLESAYHCHKTFSFQ